jgi:cytochrome c-type biogenesis protein CcmF
MIDAGHYALAIAFVATSWSVIAAILASLEHRETLQRSAERALYGAAALISFATFVLVRGFVMDDFRLDYVYSYSSTSQGLSYKIGALWGGQSGSLLLWVLLLALMGCVMLWTNRRTNRALMPVATAVIAGLMLFFLYMLTAVDSPFSVSAMRPDGVGLNPQLKNYWMMIHPPTLYVGYVAFSIPFAFAIAALATGRTGDIWFRTTRRWTLFAWVFLGTGVLLGSYWAYMELGWGGYWAWDPVENASLMPWLVGTAFLHSVMVQERKGMLKIWNMTLILLTFNLAIFGTFLTRSGIISSVHAFATSDIVRPFGIFLGVCFFGSVTLLLLRLDQLKSKARLESLISRESTFLFNNLIFVGIAGTVLLLTTFPMITELVTGDKVTMGPPIFNLVNIPWALVLLFLTGVGPLIAWKRASTSNLKKQFLLPGLVGLWTFALMFVLDGRAYFNAVSSFFSAVGRLNVRDGFGALQAFYPALAFALGAFVIGTVAQEFIRGIRARRHNRKENLPIALYRLVARDKRRYGGYIVHVGMVLIFFGVAGSSAYKQEIEHEFGPGESFQIGRNTLTYDHWELAATDDHYGSVMNFSVQRDNKPLGTILVEQRYHPNMVFPSLRQAFLDTKALGEKTNDENYQQAVLGLFTLTRKLEESAGREVKIPSTEVGILPMLSLLSPSTFGQDLYVTPLGINPNNGLGRFRIFVNPMVNFLWFGGLLFIFGAGICVLPDAREKSRLAAARHLEQQERAVA